MTDIDDDRRAALVELHQLNAEQMHLEDQAMSTANPPRWAVRLNQRDARRGDRCRRCGHRKTITTEHGPHCEAHAALLPPPLPHHHDRDDQEHTAE